MLLAAFDANIQSERSCVASYQTREYNLLVTSTGVHTLMGRGSWSHQPHAPSHLIDLGGVPSLESGFLNYAKSCMALLSLELNKC